MDLHVFSSPEYKHKVVFSMPYVYTYVCIVTYLVTRDGVWTGNWIYWSLTNRKYN
jgi:hypothetical protein